MLAMTSAALPNSPHGRRPSTGPPPARRLVLVPAAESSGRGDELVRRYRLARLRLEPRETRGDERFAHLKHVHD
jgi:hypothetical protein